LVKVLGELVDPEEIERELVVLSGGSLAPGTFAIIAVPDERAGHVLVPVFDAAVDEAAMEAVLAGYAAQAPGFRRLGPALRLPSLPRSPLGKPRRAEILALISCQAAGAAAKDQHPSPPRPRFPS
jgi:acyl-CoA synthetase (AMP-forming)/AMP-acid ligase II